MRRFAALLDGLVYMPARNAKLRLMQDYFQQTPDPDRGWALAALADTLDLPAAKPAVLRSLVATRVDPVLFALSYDYVGDLAETCALIWPTRAAGAPPGLADVCETLRGMHRDDVGQRLATWLDVLDTTERWALLKLITGGLRVGVSARLARTALATGYAGDLADIEELWHALTPPYAALFAWLEGRAARPDISTRPVFRPFMLAQPLTDGERLDPVDFQVEWKWDGVRVQLFSRDGTRRLYSRSGDDISRAFPDVLDGIGVEAVLDGELLVRRPDGVVAPFNDLQQRLNRKTVSRAMLERHPAFLRAYDVLFDGTEDLRPLPLRQRRERLERLCAGATSDRLDLSETLAARSWDDIAGLRSAARRSGMEGLMLKRRDGAYIAGRPTGEWYKWKRDPLSADVVLMYAQRGHGKRSSYYSDYTFGAWRDGTLVPVGKAYFGFTDAELMSLDRWVRNRTVKRFGPVREVEKTMVLEVAFDSVHRSTRHKSGIAMRFPRIKRIRADKPAAQADDVATLMRLVES